MHQADQAGLGRCVVRPHDAAGRAGFGGEPSALLGNGNDAFDPAQR